MIFTNQQPPQRGGAVSLLRLDWVEMAVGFSEDPSYPRHSTHTNYFFAVLPSERLQMSSMQPL